jgi:hypothetical protein
MAVEGLYPVPLFPSPFSSLPFVHPKLFLTDLRYCQTMLLFEVLGSLMFRYSSYRAFCHAWFRRSCITCSGQIRFPSSSSFCKCFFDYVSL